jgi:hypothetical protein
MPEGARRDDSMGQPARLDAGQAGKILGFQGHDIPVLVSAKLLKPLGHPAPNGPKYFATCELVELASSREWLHKATEAIHKYWRKKNSMLRGGGGNTSFN